MAQLLLLGPSSAAQTCRAVCPYNGVSGYDVVCIELPLILLAVL